MVAKAEVADAALLARDLARGLEARKLTSALQQERGTTCVYIGRDRYTGLINAKVVFS